MGSTWAVTTDGELGVVSAGPGVYKRVQRGPLLLTVS